MTVKALFALALLLQVYSASCQEAAGRPVNGQDFALFAHRQDSLFVKAYEQRDTRRYDSLLRGFLEYYDLLPAQERKVYAHDLYEAYYNFCCTWSLLNNRPRALEYLEKSIKAGFYNYAHLNSDPDLENIRGERRFGELTSPLRATGDYLYILKKAAAYDPEDKRALPAFTYLPASDPALAALRKTYRLDSIAGTGNDVSKVLNLLHWVHNLVPHDGNSENPVIKNAMSLIGVCQRDSRGLNCRGLATVLNECYLSMGFPSRFVTCLPKDSLQVDPDCHVINMVYLAGLKKWVWIDPTNDAYIMNKKGELLSIEEVRDRIIRDRPLIVNPDANWNHRSSTLKEDYLYRYMAKNLYMLQCPVNSDFDTETLGKGKVYAYIQLLPLDYFRQGPDKTERKYPQDNGVQVTYRTNDPGKFWAVPN